MQKQKKKSQLIYESEGVKIVNLNVVREKKQHINLIALHVVKWLNMKCYIFDTVRFRFFSLLFRLEEQPAS